MFAFIVLRGAAVAALFANDGAALILTPIVMAMLTALGFSAAATLAFVMAAGFNTYAAVMVPVNMVAVLASLLMLLLYFDLGHAGRGCLSCAGTHGKAPAALADCGQGPAS